jgi:hypothetical protein
MLFDDCQAESDTCAVGSYAFGTALKRLGKRGSQPWVELLAGVFDDELHTLCVSAGRDPHGALLRPVRHNPGLDGSLLHPHRWRRREQSALREFEAARRVW